MDGEHTETAEIHSHTLGFLRSNFFIFLCGQAVMFVFWVVGFAATYGKREAVLDGVIQWKAETDGRIKKMDSEGSTWAKSQQTFIQLQVDSLKAAISEEREQTRQVSVMATKIQRIEDDVKDIKNSLRK